MYAIKSAYVLLHHFPLYLISRTPLELFVLDKQWRSLVPPKVLALVSRVLLNRIQLSITYFEVTLSLIGVIYGVFSTMSYWSEKFICF